MSKLKIKDSLYIMEDTDGDYIFISSATRKVKKFQADSLVKDTLALLESEPSRFNLTNRLLKKYKETDINSCLQTLEENGILQEIGENNNQRYSKQMQFINELTHSYKETEDLQEKIENSKIAVFGIGGIGTWIVNGLYQMGVGEIRITDPDIIEESNLNRQLFFDSRDIDRYKVDIIKEKLPDANIIPFKKKVCSEENLEEIILGCSFLVNCADSPSIVETTKIIRKYAEIYQIPYSIAGGYNLHLGMVGSIIIPNKTKTFDDFIEYQKKNDPFKNMRKVRDMKQTGNIGAIAGAVANIHVMEIFKHLIGKGEVNYNKFAEIDFMNLNVEWRKF